jgi:hypothetical protein
MYGAPVLVPARAEDPSADRDRLPGRPVADSNAYVPGAVRDQYQYQYQRDPLQADGDTANRLQPVPVAVAADTSSQIRRMPTRGAGPGSGSGQGMPPFGMPPASPEAGMGLPPVGAPQPGGQQPPAGHSSAGHPTGAQPVLQTAPVAPVDQNGMGYPDGRGGGTGAASPMMTAPNAGPQQGPLTVGPGQAGSGQAGAGQAGGGSQVPTSAHQMPHMPGVPQMPPSMQGLAGPQYPAPQYPMGQQLPGGPQMPGGPQAPGGPQRPMGQQEAGGQSGPIGLVPGTGGYAGNGPDNSPGSAGVSLADAVQSAHEEGQAFGDSVARDAPALWLEAVLARKPRMPSDLEARLLQGSSLPIDFLLHDEVRHALRRGFWDALERTRR